MNGPAEKVDLLVIGYGNTLRSDDAAGPRAAEAIARLRLPGVRVIVTHQLTPELAEPLSQSRRAVFVDASAEPGDEVRLEELLPMEGEQRFTHSASPRSLLAMSSELFGACPRAWWLTIPVQSMEFGERLSPLTTEGVSKAVERIRTLVTTLI